MVFKVAVQFCISFELYVALLSQSQTLTSSDSFLESTHNLCISFSKTSWHFPPSSPGFISNMSTHRQYFPDEEDATGAAKALMRLQDTYQLDSEAFARGKLPGNQDECELITLRKHEKVKRGKLVFTFIRQENERKELSPPSTHNDFKWCVGVCLFCCQQQTTCVLDPTHTQYNFVKLAHVDQSSLG